MFLILLASSEASAIESLFIPFGEKVILQNSGPFHFSSKDGIKVFPNSSPPFFTTSKVGVFEFYQKQKKYRAVSLSSTQYEFYQKVSLLVQNLSAFDWNIENEALVLSTKNVQKEIRSFLITKCKHYSRGDIQLEFKSEIENQEISGLCKKNLRPKSERRVNLVVMGSNTSSNSNYGLGVPASIKWRLENGSDLNLAEQNGDLNLNKGNARSKGDFVFASTISLKNPAIFEMGSEVGIQAPGLFNRQATEWKKATTNIQLDMEVSSKNETKIKLTFDRRNRTAQGLVFEVEKVNKSIFLKDNVWQKVLTFQETNKSKNKNGIFGLGITGSTSRALSNSSKEVWVKVGRHD